MKIAQIRQYDIANGDGIRTTVFVSGCFRKCKGCFNKQYQNFDYGDNFDNNNLKIILQYLSDDKVEGLSILGGEPFDNKEGVLKLVKTVKEIFPNKSIWIYSGYTFEELMQDKISAEILKYCNILIDGMFVEELKNLKLRFRGSENQRIIDVINKRDISKEY